MAKLPQVDTAIRRLVPEAGKKQTEYFDEKTPGLSLIVGSKTKSWSLTYRPPGGKRKRIAFGRYPSVGLAMARDRAQGVFASLHSDVDPAARRKAYRDAPTVAVAGEEYLWLYAAKKASRRFDESAIRKELAPALGERKLVEITRRDVQGVLRTVLDRGAGIMANRVLAVLRKFFGWCVEQGWIEVNPSAGISRPTVEQSRSRTLSDAELHDLWTALRHVSPQARACFKLLLLTGQREMEVVRMGWSEIDLERGVWTLPPHDPGRSKTRTAPHLVALAPASVAILSEVAEKGRHGACVFRGRRRDGSAAGPTRGILVAAKEDLDARHLQFAEPWRIHDLRRTVRTGLSQLSVPPHIAELIIGHSIGGIVKVYDRYDYMAEKREALTRWADHLLTIVGERPGSENVVSIGGARAL
jgi:integrase